MDGIYATWEHWNMGVDWGGRNFDIELNVHVRPIAKWSMQEDQFVSNQHTNTNTTKNMKSKFYS